MAMATIVEPGALNHDQIERFAEQLDELTETPRLVGPNGQAIDLPIEIYEILHQVADELRQGYAVTVLPLSAVLTTAQAAELLNVSRPYVVKLIDEDDIKHHMAGTHRRVALADLLAYKARRDQARQHALAEMHAIADEAGMDL